MGFLEYIVKITLNTQFYLEKALDRYSLCKEITCICGKNN